MGTLTNRLQLEQALGEVNEVYHFLSGLTIGLGFTQLRCTMSMVQNMADNMDGVRCVLRQMISEAAKREQQTEPLPEPTKW